MQRKPMIGDKTNSHSLSQLPVDEAFWQAKNLDETHQLLWNTLILKGGHAASLEHADLHILLQIIAAQLPIFVTNDVRRTLQKLKNDPAELRKEEDVMQSAEKYLSLAAAINFYLGNYQEAARCAGLLGNAYFLYRHRETAALCSHFNHLAALAYQQCGNEEMAAHHFNQYLVGNKEVRHIPAEVSAATEYLLHTRQLVCTRGLLELLERKADECDDDRQLAGTLRRQAGRAENGAIYEDLDRAKTRKNLLATLDQLLKSFQSTGSLTAGSTVFAAKNSDDAEVSALPSSPSLRP